MAKYRVMDTTICYKFFVPKALNYISDCFAEFLFQLANGLLVHVVTSFFWLGLPKQLQLLKDHVDQFCGSSVNFVIALHQVHGLEEEELKHVISTSRCSVSGREFCHLADPNGLGCASRIRVSMSPCKSMISNSLFGTEGPDSLGFSAFFFGYFQLDSPLHIGT